ncbi:hypothetical protein Tco_1147198, partial [Tanacetum coccineum]
RSCDGLYNTVFGVMVYSVGVTGLAAALEELPAATIVAYENVIQKKAYNALILCLGDRVLREITKETTAVGIWKKLETLCMIKSLANRLYLKKKLYTFNMHPNELLDWIKDSVGSYHMTYKRDYLFDFEEYDYGNILLGDGRECRKIKVIRGSLVVLSRRRRADCVYTLNGQAMTKKTLKGRKQLEEYQDGWKIKACNVLDSCNQGSTQQCMKSGAEDTTMSTYLVNRSSSSTISFKIPIDTLGFLGWLASIKQRMLEPVKVKCIFLRCRKGIVANKLWRLDDVTSKVVLYRNMGFNKSGEYKKTFIGSGVGTSSMQVLHGFEFEVEPLGDHAFEMEPQENVDQGAEYNNEAAFAVAAVDKIYAHESLNFNDTIACEVIFKWKAELKEDMDILHMCMCSTTVAGKAVTTTMTITQSMHQIIRDHSGNTLRVSRSRIYNEKLVQTLLEGHSILSLEESLSGDYDVEKNGKWSYRYAVGSQEYQVFVDFDYVMGRSITVMSRSITGYGLMIQAVKEAIWLMGLLEELGVELNTVAVNWDLEAKTVKVLKVCTEHNAADVLTKVVPERKLQHCFELLSVGVG